MVNNDPRIIVIGACITRVNARGSTAITNGPIYNLVKAQVFLKVHGLRVITDKGVSDQATEFNPELDDNELVKFICELNTTDYQSSERCATSVGMTVDCDAYAMKWNRIDQKRWEHGRKIFVKFGFSNNNPRCLIVSIHPAKW